MLLVVLVFSGCAARATCDALDGAAEACGFVEANDECLDDVEAGDCEDTDLQGWRDYLDCLAEACSAGSEQADAEQACTGRLDGISWSCTPWGPAGV